MKNDVRKQSTSDISLDYVIDISNKFSDILESVRFCSGYGRNPIEIIEAANKLKALGLSWGEKLDYQDFRIRKKYYITNSATKYKPDKDKYYIEWDNGNVGRLQFVSEKYWGYVEDEWMNFLSKLKSYSPVDYDPLNCHMIFEVENGMKLIKDYPTICHETREKMKKKINAVRLEEIKTQYESLQKEMEQEGI